MICKLLRTIELLDELQYWIDNWTHCNASKRYVNFECIEHELEKNGDRESARIAGKAGKMSIMLPFKGRETLGPHIYNVPYLGDNLKTVMVTP